MPELKYAQYLARNVVADNKWGGQGISLSKLPDGIVPPKSKMTLGITAVKAPYMFHEPVHKHNFTEYFLFFGSGPCMNDFAASVEFHFGEERQKQVIDSPSIIVAAPMVYHCPLNYAAVTQPFYCLEAFMATNRTEIKLEDDKDSVEIKTPETNYNRFVVKNVVAGNKWGGENISLSRVPDNLLPAGAKMSLGVTLVRKPYMFHEPVHRHSFTEFFYFFGSNPLDMKEFDAEVEFSLGPEKEKHVIKEPTIVAIPPGLYHCPLKFASVGKPIYCLEAFLASSYTSENLDETKKS
jgi:hypothetical protein